MRQGALFTKTRKEAPKDEQAISAQLLIRAGYINKEMAGVYDYLPLGLRVLKKIESIIREEMNAIGGQELLLTTLQDPKIWKKTGRWDDKKIDIWFKSQLKSGGEIGIANTHEEPLTALLSQFVSSYNDLPLYAYQFQTKFRNELRAKSGIIRTREFIMKDLYSFNKSEDEFKDFYEKCAKTYLKIFNRVGLGEITYRTVAAGGSFTENYTDEFQTVCSAGEDTIYLDENKKLAINKEVYNDKTLVKFGLNKDELKEARSIEVGNIFPYSTLYTEAFGLNYTDTQGKSMPVYMGAYGIGLGRLMGAVVETHNDEKGIVWPESIAPFSVHLVVLDSKSREIASFAESLYADLQKARIEVLYDDRDVSAGVKFADSDLLGIPIRLVVSRRLIEKKQLELKQRTETSEKILSSQDILKELKKYGYS